MLKYGSPESVGLLSDAFKDLKKNVTEYMTPANYGSASNDEVHPLYPGATVMIGHESTVVSHFAVGHTFKYADANGTEVPKEHQTRTENDTIYDIASLTKMFTTIAALQQLESGKLSLDATVATYVPDFATNGKENITILMLMTHTSGFGRIPGLWTEYQTYDERKKAIIEQKLLYDPGTTFWYSDLNFMNLQFVLEAVTGTPLDQLLHDKFTGPLGMKDSFFNRGNKALSEKLMSRIAATEYQIEAVGPMEPQRSQPVWGTVHDEKAWSLDGVAGHAGMFSTAWDLGIFCQMILNNGTYNGIRILQPSTVDLIFHDFNAAFPEDAHGLGFKLGQFQGSGAMHSLQTAGHTGFTGTSMVIDRSSNTFFIFLTNRVHPSRTWSNINRVREMVGTCVARSFGRNV